VYIHIPNCIETVYELPLLPNNTASETLFHKSGALRSADWIFFNGALAQWRLDEYVTWHKTFYNLLFKQEVAATPVTSKFCIPEGGLYSKYNNYTMDKLYNYNMH